MATQTLPRLISPCRNSLSRLAAVKRATRFALALQLRHRATVGAEFAELGIKLLALPGPVHCDFVGAVIVAADLQPPCRRSVVKHRDQHVRAKVVITVLAAPLAG